MGKLAPLTAEQRAAIAYQLLESLDEAGDADWDAARTAELQRRNDMIDAGEEDADMVISDLRERYS
jgi:hypothetical protein